MLAGFLALSTVPQLGVNALVRQLESGDPQAVADASRMLRERGPEALPAVLKALHDTSSCQLKFVLVGVVRELQPDSPVPNATLLSMAQAKCKMRLPVQVAIFRRQASFALAARADGAAAVIAMLQSGDVAQRQTAVFGLADVMKGLATGVPKLDLTPAFAEANKLEVAALGRALKDSDDHVKCAAYDALTDAGEASAEDLKQQAAKLLEGVPKPKCPVK
jgi:hypothetical protein